MALSCRTNKNIDIKETNTTDIFYRDTIIKIEERIDTFYVEVPKIGDTISSNSVSGSSIIYITRSGSDSLFIKNKLFSEQIKIDSAIKIVEKEKIITKTSYINKCENAFHNFAVYFFYFITCITLIYLIISKAL